MGITAVAPQPGTSKRHRAHLVYPYLLRHQTITRANHVWAMDITYIPMAWGFVYLAAVMDCASQKVLSWRVSTTLDIAFCIEAVEEAIARYGRPKSLNSDQGSQCTSADFTGLLTAHGIRISMDGQGCWRTIKYEEVNLRVRHGRRGAGWPRPLPHALQHPPPPLEPRRQHPRRAYFLTLLSPLRVAA